MAVCEADQFFFVEDDRSPRLDGEDLGPGGNHHFERLHADRGHVEPHVLLRLGDFDDREAAGAAQFSGADDATIGPLDRLDGEHGLGLHGHALADVPAADLLGHPPAELDVALLGRRRGGGSRRLP